MSFFSQLFGKRAGGRKVKSRPAGERVYLVEATGLVDSRQRNGGGQASPRDNFAVLRVLAQFAGREAIEIQAVFTGRALREAGEGEQFRGVRVFYAENGAAARTKLKALIQQLARRKDVVLLSADPALEREAVELGASCMRHSTLRKSFEERDERDRDRGERPRAPSFRSDEIKAPQPQAPEQKEKPDVEDAPRGPENPKVLDLIDPV